MYNLLFSFKRTINMTLAVNGYNILLLVSAVLLAIVVSKMIFKCICMASVFVV